MGPKILLVEDEEAIATVLKTAFGIWGYDGFHAADMRGAIQLARVHGDEIRMVLCDVLLPDGSGPAAVAEIQRLCPGVPSVLTSGFSMDVLAERGLLTPESLRELGATYLQKPFLPRDVHSLIDSALRESHVGPHTGHIPERIAHARMAH